MWPSSNSGGPHSHGYASSQNHSRVHASRSQPPPHSRGFGMSSGQSLPPGTMTYHSPSRHHHHHNHWSRHSHQNHHSHHRTSSSSSYDHYNADYRYRYHSHHLSHSDGYRPTAPTEESYYHCSKRPHSSEVYHSIPAQHHRSSTPPSYSTRLPFPVSHRSAESTELSPSRSFSASSPSNNTATILTSTGCTCKKSFCLKLYCQCFASSAKCNPAKCKCSSCHNTILHQSHIQTARQTILDRNPNAFQEKFIEQEDGSSQTHLSDPDDVERTTPSKTYYRNEEEEEEEQNNMKERDIISLNYNEVKSQEDVEIKERYFHNEKVYPDKNDVEEEKSQERMAIMAALAMTELGSGKAETMTIQEEVQDRVSTENMQSNHKKRFFDFVEPTYDVPQQKIRRRLSDSSDNHFSTSHNDHLVCESRSPTLSTPSKDILSSPTQVHKISPNNSVTTPHRSGDTSPVAIAPPTLRYDYSSSYSHPRYHRSDHHVILHSPPSYRQYFSGRTMDSPDGKIMIPEATSSDYQSRFSGPPRNSSTGLPKALSFRKICSKCGKTRGEHGELGFGNKCVYQDCGRCGAGIQMHVKSGIPMGFFCTLTVENGATPGASENYEKKIKELAIMAELKKESTNGKSNHAHTSV